MKGYGYILPTMPVIDFVPVVYKMGENFFLYNSEKNNAQSFQLIDIDATHIKRFENPISLADTDGEPIYCFIAGNGDPIIGTYFKIFGSLLNLLTSNKLSIFSQISVFKFLQMTGRLFGLLMKLREEYYLLNFPYFIHSPLHDSFIDSEDEKVAKDFIEISKDLIVKYSGKLYWTDIFFVYNDYVYYSRFKTPLNVFIHFSTELQSIINQYCIGLDYYMVYKTYAKNNSLFSKIIDNNSLLSDSVEQNFNYRCYLLELEMGGSFDTEPQHVGLFGPKESSLDIKKLKSMIRKKSMSNEY